MPPRTASEPAPSRYVVGFDLGTTNSAVTYVDTAEEPWRVSTFAVPQLVAAGQHEARETLPSFHYQPAQGEMPPASLRLPWDGARRHKRDSPIFADARIRTVHDKRAKIGTVPSAPYRRRIRT